MAGVVAAAAAPTATQEAVEQLRLFEGLKAQIVSIATALYGTAHSPSPTPAFDVITYYTYTPQPQPQPQPQPLSTSTTLPSALTPSAPALPTPIISPTPHPASISAALITYPRHTPPSFTAFCILARSEPPASSSPLSSSPIPATRALLSDLRVALGAVMADLAQKRKTKVLHRRVPDVQTSNNADADADNSDDDDDVEDGGEHGVKDGWRTGRDLDSLAWPREEWRPFMGGRDFWADGSEWEGPGVRAAIMRWLERKKEDGRWYSKFI